MLIPATSDDSLDKIASDPFADYQRVFENRLDCVKLLDVDGRLLRINACGVAALEINNSSEAVGTNYFDFWAGEDREAALEAAAKARQEGSGRFSGTYVSRTGRISIWDEVINRVTDAEGHLSGYLIISRDLTQYRDGLARQKAMSDLSMLALEPVPFHEVLKTIVERLSTELRCPLTKVLQFVDEADELKLVAGVGWQEGLEGNATVGVDQDSQAGFTLLAEGPVIVEDLETESRFSGPPLLREHGVRSGMSVVIRGSGSRPFGVLGIHTRHLRKFENSEVDFMVAAANLIAARWRQEQAEANRRILMREMAHRAGNLLQITNSIFLSTLREANDFAEAKDKFTQRLAAMARANLLLAKGGWSAAQFHEVISNTLQPFGENYSLTGRDILLPGDLCFDLSLVLFELSTNSAKYGAFGPGDGEVKISWKLAGKVKERVLILIWNDSSRQVESKPCGTGFGSRLIKQIVETKYGGNVSVSETQKYQCELKLQMPKTLNR